MLEKVLDTDGSENLLLKSGDITKIFCVCFFISFKMLEDLQMMFVEDLATLTGFNIEMLEALEKAILVDVLEWKTWVSEKEVETCKTALITDYYARQEA